jgi:hypothetical protein
MNTPNRNIGGAVKIPDNVGKCKNLCKNLATMEAIWLFIRDIELTAGRCVPLLFNVFNFTGES